ncbi:MAG TPA: ABC transporter permease [Castellaniella sp.]|nr:ABC transporter permease [Castellaniella sp.]
MAAEVSTPLAAASGRRAFARAEDAALNADEARLARREVLRHQRNCLLLVLPLLAFLIFAFFAPIGSMLYRSVYQPSVSELIPQTLAQLSKWDSAGDALPRDETFSIFAAELRELGRTRQSGVLAEAVNRVYPGASSAIKSSARKLRNQDPQALVQEGRSLLEQAHPFWGKLGAWRAIDRAGQAYTDANFLTALDLERNADGDIQARQSAKIYLQLYGKTMLMALIITLACMVLGYPLAYYLAHAPAKVSNMLMVLVLLPFWTSLLVRTTAWIAILQSNGVINALFEWLGLIDQPLHLLYTRYATIIAMTHILLPFMILPLYSVMRGIDRSYVRAAVSMGSNSFSAFRRVYLPLTLPGLSAGALLVFIVSVGYYITPALVGGTDGQMISNIIAFHMQQTNNWGLAAALGTLLLVLILTLYWIYDRVIGSGNLKLG